MSHGFDVHMLDVEGLFNDSADFPSFLSLTINEDFPGRRLKSLTSS